MEAVSARAGTLALALVPIALGIGRFFPVYITPGYDVWYQYRSILLYASDALVAITVVAWIASRRSPSVRSFAVATGFAVLALASAVSAVTAIDGVLSLGTAAHLFLLTLFVLAAADLASRSSRRWMVSTLCAAVVAQAALAVWQAATQSTAPAALFNGWDADLAARDAGASVAAIPGVDRWLRSYGSFPHPNALGAFVAASLAVLLMRPEVPMRLRTAALVGGTIALSLSFSRSSWLALALAAPAWLVATHGLRGASAWLVRRMRTRPVLVALVAIGILLAGSRFARLDAATEGRSIDERRLEDDAARSLIVRGAPVGAGNIVLAERSVDPGASLGEPPHDVFVIAVAELGIGGILGWLALLVALATMAWRARDDPSARAGPLTAAALLFPLLLLDHYLWTQPPGRTLLAWTLALLVTQPRINSTSSRWK